MECKFHAFTKMPRLPTRCLLSAWTLVLPCLWALSGGVGAAPGAAQPVVAAASAVRDRDAPLLFDAGQMKIDAKRKVRLLTGDVQLTRGSFELKSQQVELRETAQGGDFAVATSAPGLQAHFRQRREGMDEVIDGQADRIEYDAKTEIVRLIGNAVLKRLRGNSITDEVSGQTIIYEHLRETFEVQGSGAGSRVKGVVTPQTKGSAEAGR